MDGLVSNESISTKESLERIATKELAKIFGLNKEKTTRAFEHMGYDQEKENSKTYFFVGELPTKREVERASIVSGESFYLKVPKEMSVNPNGKSYFSEERVARAMGTNLNTAKKRLRKSGLYLNGSRHFVSYNDLVDIIGGLKIEGLDSEVKIDNSIDENKHLKFNYLKLLEISGLGEIIFSKRLKELGGFSKIENEGHVLYVDGSKIPDLIHNPAYEPKQNSCLSIENLVEKTKNEDGSGNLCREYKMGSLKELLKKQPEDIRAAVKYLDLATDGKGSGTVYILNKHDLRTLYGHLN